MLLTELGDETLCKVSVIEGLHAKDISSSLVQNNENGAHMTASRAAAVIVCQSVARICPAFKSWLAAEGTLLKAA